MTGSTVDYACNWNARFDGIETSCHLRPHPRIETGQHLLQLSRSKTRDEHLVRWPVDIQASDVGEHHQSRSIQTCCKRSGGSVTIHVMRLAFSTTSHA